MKSKLIKLFCFTVIMSLYTGCSDTDSPVDPIAEDRTPPDIWWTSPEGGITLQDTVSIELAYSGKSEVDSVSLVRDGTKIEVFILNNSEGSLEYLWDTTSDSDGVHIWEARAWDDSGNMGQSLSLLVRVRNNPEPPPEDHTPPVVDWLSPDPGTEVAGAVTLSFQAMDDVRLDSATVFINGQRWQHFQYSESFHLENVLWNSNNVSDATYYISVRAWDRSQMQVQV